MPVEPGFEFSNIERLIRTIGASKDAPPPHIDAARLLAELAVVKDLVADSPYPDIDATIPVRIRRSISGPLVPVPNCLAPSGPDHCGTAPVVPIPGQHDVGITGPEVDTGACPLCKRPY